MATTRDLKCTSRPRISILEAEIRVLEYTPKMQSHRLQFRGPLPPPSSSHHSSTQPPYSAPNYRHTVKHRDTHQNPSPHQLYLSTTTNFHKPIIAHMETPFPTIPTHSNPPHHHQTNTLPHPPHPHLNPHHKIHNIHHPNNRYRDDRAHQSFRLIFQRSSGRQTCRLCEARHERLP